MKTSKDGNKNKNKINIKISVNKDKKKLLETNKKKKKKKKLKKRPKRYLAKSPTKGKKRKKGKFATKRPLAKKPKKKKKNEKKKEPKPASLSNQDELNAKEIRSEIIKKGLIKLTSNVTGIVYNERGEIDPKKSKNPSNLEIGLSSLINSFKTIADSQKKIGNAAETKEERNAKMNRMQEIKQEIFDLRAFQYQMMQNQTGMKTQMKTQMNQFQFQMNDIQFQINKIIDTFNNESKNIKEDLKKYQDEIEKYKKEIPKQVGINTLYFQEKLKNFEELQKKFDELLKSITNGNIDKFHEIINKISEFKPTDTLEIVKLKDQILKLTNMVKNLQHVQEPSQSPSRERSRSPSPNRSPTPKIRESTPIDEDGKEAFKKFAIYYNTYIGWSKWSKIDMDVVDFWDNLVVEFKKQNTKIKTRSGSVINKKKKKRYDSWASIVDDIESKKDSIIFFLNNKAASIKDQGLKNEKISSSELKKILSNLGIKDTGL